MAGDWIKMRVMLPSDPKVIQMASVLAKDRQFMNWLTDPVQESCRDSAWEHVDQRVIVAVTVMALLSVWGVSQERGKRDGNDMILTFVTVDVLDDVALIPGIGKAMEAVGWVIQDGPNLRFPNYLDDNSITRERLKEQARLRQKRHRDKVRDSHGEESVTDTEIVTIEKSREAESRADQSREQALPQDTLLNQDAPSGDACSLLARIGMDAKAIQFLRNRRGVDDCAIHWAVTRFTEETAARRAAGRDRIANPPGYVRKLLEKETVPQAWRDEWNKRRLAESAAQLKIAH